jgi:hypothetical protein
MRFILILLVILGCRYDDTSRVKYNSIITGYDVRDCACCGGLLINFEDQTQPYQGNYFLIDNTPSDLGIEANSTFPIYALVEYLVTSNVCGGNHVHITSFKKIK